MLAPKEVIDLPHFVPMLRASLWSRAFLLGLPRSVASCRPQRWLQNTLTSTVKTEETICPFVLTTPPHFQIRYD